MNSKSLLEIPEIIYDYENGKKYQRGLFFGKGSFAKCYEMTEIGSGSVYAGKIVSRRLMAKTNQKDTTQEIKIHRSLTHKNVVGFKDSFGDCANVYIILELCQKRSMMELYKRRKTLTEVEIRFYLKQILTGVHYLHQCKIIHRDLKLGNLFLNDDLQVKIGDFGLATKVEYIGERKKTLCGTPNYIAPEILHKKGHSFEVDVWSIGCIMYTLLIGNQPFDTASLEKEYSKLRKREYRDPKTISSATHMVNEMLHYYPHSRPKCEQLLGHKFIVSGYLPQSLPASCLTMAPRFNHLQACETAVNNHRKPLLEASNNLQDSIVASSSQHKSMIGVFDARDSLTTLAEQLFKLLHSKMVMEQSDGDKQMTVEMTDPAAQPLFWISKCAYDSDEYEFGYQLCDESVGVLFNDTTKLIMLANGMNVHYIARDGTETYMTVDSYPETLEKQMNVLSDFHRCMNKNLMPSRTSDVNDSNTLSRIPHLHQWCRTASAVIMQLTNGTVQVNFREDNTEIILCPLMTAVTFIDVDKSFRTFRFSTLEENGCSTYLYRNLRYAYDKIKIFLQK